MKTEVYPLRVVVKALCLFVVINIVYALADPQLAGISAYNSVFPGLKRMPFGGADNPYTVMIDDVGILMASHALAGEKKPNEFRVVLIGDSSIWGPHLALQDTLSEQWNRSDVHCGGLNIEVYNLGYPHPSVIKDLLVLDESLRYDPDLIVWFITLNTLTPRQLNEFLIGNRDRVRNVLDVYQISFEGADALLDDRPTFFEKTLIGKRSYLARFIKLQMLGIIWGATHVDIDFREKRNKAPLPILKEKISYKGMAPGSNLTDIMILQALAAGHEIASTTPILVVNEPIYVATGANSELRYNDGYPRWAYDQYREIMTDVSREANWNYLDLWDSIPQRFFSNAGLYLSRQGEHLLMERINPSLQTISCQ